MRRPAPSAGAMIGGDRAARLLVAGAGREGTQTGFIREKPSSPTRLCDNSNSFYSLSICCLFASFPSMVLGGVDGPGVFESRLARLLVVRSQFAFEHALPARRMFSRFVSGFNQ